MATTTVIVTTGCWRCPTAIAVAAASCIAVGHTVGEVEGQRIPIHRLNQRSSRGTVEEKAEGDGL